MTGSPAAQRLTFEMVLVSRKTLSSSSSRSISSSAVLAAGTNAASSAASVISKRQAMAWRCTRIQ